MAPRKRYAFWIDLAQLDAVNRIRERDGILPSEQIRRALDAWVKARGVKADRRRARTRRRP